MLPKEVFLAAGLGGAVAATVILLCLWRRTARGCTVALALGAGYATGHTLVAGWTSLPPRDATQWLPYFGLLSVIVATPDPFFRPKQSVRIGVWAIISALGAGLLLRPMFQYSWGRLEGTLYLLCIVIGILLLTWSLEAIENRQSGLSALLWFATMVSGGTCIALMLSGSLLLGQLALVLTGVVSICFLLVLLFQIQAHRSCGAVPLVLLLAGLWLSGQFYAALPLWSTVLLAIAPGLSLLVADRPQPHRQRIFWLRSALVGASVTLAVIVAYRASPPLDY